MAARTKKAAEVKNVEVTEIATTEVETTEVIEAEELVTGSKLGNALHKAGNWLDEKKALKDAKKAEQPEGKRKSGLLKKAAIGAGVVIAGAGLSMMLFGGKDDPVEVEEDDDDDVIDTDYTDEDDVEEVTEEESVEE